MYLETILILSEKCSSVRAVDVSRFRNYSKPSVSRALGILRENGFIIIEENGNIVLTDSGREVAEKIYERHLVISGFLEYIGVDGQIAESDACKIEHVISDGTFDRIKSFMKENLPK